MLNITFHTVTLAAARHVPCERRVFFRVASVEIKSYSLVASRLIIPISPSNFIVDYSVYSSILIKYTYFFS